MDAVSLARIFDNLAMRIGRDWMGDRCIVRYSDDCHGIGMDPNVYAVTSEVARWFKPEFNHCRQSRE